MDKIVEGKLVLPILTKSFLEYLLHTFEYANKWLFNHSLKGHARELASRCEYRKIMTVMPLLNYIMVYYLLKEKNRSKSLEDDRHYLDAKISMLSVINTPSKNSEI